jgi:hypothetical protein
VTCLKPQLVINEKERKKPNEGSRRWWAERRSSAHQKHDFTSHIRLNWLLCLVICCPVGCLLRKGQYKELTLQLINNYETLPTVSSVQYRLYKNGEHVIWWLQIDMPEVCSQSNLTDGRGLYCPPLTLLEGENSVACRIVAECNARP